MSKNQLKWFKKYFFIVYQKENFENMMKPKDEWLD